MPNKPRKFDLVEATFELARRERITFSEARAKLGRRGAEACQNKRRRERAGRDQLARRKLD
ncbi:MAG: hypothetical protein QOE70_1316 [Chthoniobacter sp.]|jgi:hypothetical protein|nr:hypothetical protein [Chthoniobacter sp.]